MMEKDNKWRAENHAEIADNDISPLSLLLSPFIATKRHKQCLKVCEYKK